MRAEVWCWFDVGVGCLQAGLGFVHGLFRCLELRFYLISYVLVWFWVDLKE